MTAMSCFLYAIAIAIPKPLHQPYMAEARLPGGATALRSALLPATTRA
jgi:hypothetical protein